MTETMLRANKGSKWAVALRLPPQTFGWVVMRAGEKGQKVATYITERLEELARQDLQRKDTSDALQD